MTIYKNFEKCAAAFSMLIAACFFLIFTGCSPSLKKTENFTRVQDKPGNIVTATPGSYFNFIVSELAQSKNYMDKSLEYLIRAQKLDKNSVFLKKVLARRYLLVKDIKNSELLISELITQSPNDTETLGLYGGLLALKQSSPQDLIAIYKKIMSIDPDDEKAIIALAFLMEKTGKRNELIKLFEETLKKTEENYFLTFYLGEAYLLNRDYEKARNILYKAVNKEPQKIEPKLSLIETIKHLKKNNRNKLEIIDLFNDIIALVPDNAAPFVELSFFYNQNGNYEKSDETFAPVAEEWSLQKKKITGLLFSYVKKKDFKKAEFLTLKIYQTTGDETILMVLAELYKQSEMPMRAVFFYNSVPPNSKFYTSSIAESAYILARNNNINKAVVVLKKGLNISKNDPQLLYILGNFLEELHDYKNAAVYYERGTKIDSSKLYLFYYRLAIVMDKFGNKDKVLSNLKKSIEINSDWAESLNYLGYTYAELGINLNEAEALIKKALLLKKNDGFIMDSLGWVYYKMGNYKKALKWVEKAYKIEKKDPTILQHLGDIFVKLRKKRKAVKFYKKAVEADPENETTKEKLKELL